MQTSTIESRINQIEEQIARPRRGPWEIFQLLAPLLIPASITYCGYLYTQSQSKAQIEISKDQADRQEAIARINSKVGQAQFVASFIKSLLSDNNLEKKLAINAVLIALPEEGPQFVQIISMSDTNDSVRAFARSSLEQRRSTLIEDVHSRDVAKSSAAADDLALGWRTDTNVTKQLLAEVQKGDVTPNAVGNTLKVLQAQAPGVLKYHRAEVEQFTRQVQTNDPQTRIYLQRVQSKL